MALGLGKRKATVAKDDALLEQAKAIQIRGGEQDRKLLERLAKVCLSSLWHSKVMQTITLRVLRLNAASFSNANGTNTIIRFLATWRGYQKTEGGNEEVETIGLLQLKKYDTMIAIVLDTKAMTTGGTVQPKPMLQEDYSEQITVGGATEVEMKIWHYTYAFDEAHKKLEILVVPSSVGELRTKEVHLPLMLAVEKFLERSQTKFDLEGDDCLLQAPARRCPGHASQQAGAMP